MNTKLLLAIPVVGGAFLLGGCQPNFSGVAPAPTESPLPSGQVMTSPVPTASGLSTDKSTKSINNDLNATSGDVNQKDDFTDLNNQVK